MKARRAFKTENASRESRGLFGRSSKKEDHPKSEAAQLHPINS
jgi:hypothetical protein